MHYEMFASATTSAVNDIHLWFFFFLLSFLLAAQISYQGENALNYGVKLTGRLEIFPGNNRSKGQRIY